MELNALIHDPTLNVSQPILGHRRCYTVQLACDKLLNAIIDENASDVSLRLALGKLETCIL